VHTVVASQIIHKWLVGLEIVRPDVLLASKRKPSRQIWVGFLDWLFPPTSETTLHALTTRPSLVYRTSAFLLSPLSCPEVETAFAGDDDYEDIANLTSFCSSVHIGDTLPAHSASILSFPLWHHRLSSPTPNPLRPPLTLARTT